jgi:hypothetical protein
MKNTQSRRAVLAGLAATPALAAPALALTSAGPDPIYAIIERHRTAPQPPPTSRRLKHKGPLRGV